MVQGDALGIGDAVVWLAAVVAVSPRRARSLGKTVLSTWPAWGRYVVVAASTASWAFATVLAVTPPATDADKARAIHWVVAGFIIFAAALAFAAVCEVKRDKVNKREDRDTHRQLHEETRQHFANEAFRAADLAQQRAAKSAFSQTMPRGSSASLTELKVSAAFLADRSRRFLDDDYVKGATDETLAAEYKHIFGEELQKTRNKLANEGLVDGQLDTFTRRQGGAETIMLTAEALDRLAAQLPEDHSYLHGYGGPYASAFERFQAFMQHSLDELSQSAKTYLESRDKWPKAPRELSERAQVTLDSAEGYIRERERSEANPKRLLAVLEKTADHFRNGSQNQEMEHLKAESEAYVAETLRAYKSKHARKVAALFSESIPYGDPGGVYISAGIVKSPKTLRQVEEVIFFLRVRLSTRSMRGE